jgi:hypothetical protein
MNQPTDQAATSGAGDNMGSATGQTGQTGQGGDMLDKGVNYAEQESGHQESPATTEKVSFRIIGGGANWIRSVMDSGRGSKR